MVYVDKEALVSLIEKNKEYLKKLRELQKYNEEDFLDDWRVYSLVDRYLHLALESFLDIGKKVINQLDLKKPDRYSDVPYILAQNNIIPKNMQEKYEELAKFRNALVHDYLYLDHEIIYKHLQEDVEYLEKFVEFIKDYMKDK